jgi:hypothetical protein
LQLAEMKEDGRREFLLLVKNKECGNTERNDVNGV